MYVTVCAYRITIPNTSHNLVRPYQKVRFLKVDPAVIYEWMRGKRIGLLPASLLPNILPNIKIDGHTREHQLVVHNKRYPFLIRDVSPQLPDKRNNITNSNPVPI